MLLEDLLKRTFWISHENFSQFATSKPGSQGIVLRRYSAHHDLFGFWTLVLNAEPFLSVV